MDEMVYDTKIKNVVLLDSGSYKDFKYYIANNCGQYPVAYIKVPDNIKINCKDPYSIDLSSPHGGFTFGCENYIPPLLKGIATNGNYLGWDYAHYGDYLSYYAIESLCFMKKWTTKEILEQVKNTIDEIDELINYKGVSK